MCSMVSPATTTLVAWPSFFSFSKLSGEPTFEILENRSELFRTAPDVLLDAKRFFFAR